jgi:hypothetical protein
MHFMYGFCDRNSLAALRAYQCRCADWRQPYRRVFETAHRNLRETVTVRPHARAGSGRCSVRYEEDVLHIVKNNPSTSTRQISSPTGRLPQLAVWRTLRENQCYPFHVQSAQGLQPGSNHSLVQFSRLVVHKIVDTPQFLCRVLWTDEAVFTRSGVHNPHNLHVWTTENPHGTSHSSSQHRFRPYSHGATQKKLKGYASHRTNCT